MEFVPDHIASAVLAPARMSAPTIGYVVYAGVSQLDSHTSIVGILTLASDNRKTGGMAQLWILVAGQHPHEAVKNGADSAVCRNCKFRRGHGGACYVIPFQGPGAVWNAYRNGRYGYIARRHLAKVAKGRRIRIGAYGDPAALPAGIVATLAEHSDGWTGYTHQWAGANCRQLADQCMASVDSPEERTRAKKDGWRTFRVRRPDEPVLSGEVECPYPRVQCGECLLCSGHARDAKDVTIAVHGGLKNRF